METIKKYTIEKNYEKWISKVLDENDINPENIKDCTEKAKELAKKEKHITYLKTTSTPVVITTGYTEEKEFVSKINTISEEMFCSEVLCVKLQQQISRALLDKINDEEKKAKIKRIIKKSKDITESQKLYIIAFVNTVKEKVKLQKAYDNAKKEKKLLKGYNKISTSIVIVTTGTNIHEGLYCARLEVNRPDIQCFNKASNYSPFEDTNADITGYTFSVKLVDFIRMYNVLGDGLFQKNVRFGIADTMDVEKYMRETLERSPSLFWYYNIGITIALYNSDFKLKKYNEIILQKEIADEIKFSVINGAQTINTAARYYFELEEKIDSETNIEKKAELERIKANIEKDAYVLTRIMCIPCEKEQEVDRITVALNRQKPIRPEDIAYTLPIIKEINDFITNSESINDDEKFKIIKRGEINSEKRCMTPFKFAKIMATCSFRPDVARNNGVKKLLKYDEDKFTETYMNLYVENDNNDDEDKLKQKQEALFLRKLKAVWFVEDFFSVLEDLKLDDQQKVLEPIIMNMKWTIISFYLYIKNNGSEDYSDFHTDAEEKDEIEFAKEVAKYILNDIENKDELSKLYKLNFIFEELKKNYNNSRFTDLVK